MKYKCIDCEGKYPEEEMNIYIFEQQEYHHLFYVIEFRCEECMRKIQERLRKER